MSAAVGEVLLAEQPLERVELDVEQATATLRCAGATLVFERVAATTLLGPWDGARGTVEHAKVVAVDAGELCVEIRVRYATVPRVYRVVCANARVESAPRAGQCSDAAKKRAK